MHGKVKTNNAVTASPRDFRMAVGKVLLLLQAEVPHTGPDSQMLSFGRDCTAACVLRDNCKKKKREKSDESFSPVFFFLRYISVR